MPLPPGALASGFGQGLLGASQAVPFFAQQKQLALQNALAQRHLSLQEQQARAQEAAQAAAQIPGGVSITPEAFKSQFAGTPTGAARFMHQPATSQADNTQSVDPWFGALSGPATPAKDQPESYTSTEPFNQYKALLAAQTTVNNTQARITGAGERNAATNATREKIAAGVKTVGETRNKIMQQLGSERNAIARGRLQQQLQGLGLQEIALKLAGARIEAGARETAGRVENSAPYQNAITMSNLGIGQYPGGFDPEGVAKDVDEILKGLPDLSTPAPAPAAPKAAPKAKAPRIMGVEPIQ